MPKLITLKENLEWGDLIAFPNGSIFTVDSLGNLNHCYGPAFDVTTDDSEGLNEDVQTGTCIPIAFRYLGLPEVSVGLSHDDVAKLLVKYDRLTYSGNLAEFVRLQPTGSFYIEVRAYGRDRTDHALALIDGVINNLKWDTPSHEVRRAWRIIK